MSKLDDSLNKIISLEELAEKDTFLHQLHPMAKIITTLVYLVVVISFGKYNLSGLLLFFVYPMIMMPLGEIPNKPIFARLLVALPFSFFAGISNLFFDRAIALVVLGYPVSYGLISLITIIIKTMLTVSAVLILIATTSMDKISYEMVRAKVPPIFVMQLMLTFRYLSVLMKEAGNMLTAYHLRSDKQKGIHIAHAGSFVGQLLMRSFDKADKVYYAMKCRGFDGEYLFAKPEKAKPKDYLFMVSICLLFLVVRYMG